MSQFNGDFIKHYKEEIDEGYLLEDDVQNLEKVQKLHDDFPFLPEKLASNLQDKTEYVIRIRNLKQALNHGLVLKKVHSVIKFNQTVLLKLYFDMHADLRKKAKNDFQK